MTRILIVDDKEENLSYLRTLLTSEDCTVDDAHNGAEALAKARLSPPDIIISDLLMPVMDGYTLLRHWKRDGRLKRVPFIIYTATYRDAEDERLALSLGADAFLLKPAEPDHLLTRIGVVMANAVSPSPVEPRTPTTDENDQLKLYSEVLVRKLEEKTLQLEKSNRALRKDIVEREKAEQAQRRMAETQVGILNALPAHIALLDSHGVIVAVNEAWRRFSTANVLQSSDFCVGQNYLGVCESAHGECSEESRAVATGIRKVLSGEAKEFGIEYPCHSPSEQRWFRLMVTPLSETPGTGVVVMHVNVTERRLAEEILRQKERVQRRLAEELTVEMHRLHESQAVAHVGSWETDLTTLEVTWTEETFRIFETTPEEFKVTQQGFLERIHPEDRGKVNDALNRSIGQPGPFAIEHRLLFPDGRIKFVEERWQALNDATGRPLRTLGTCQDITERKLAERAVTISEASLTRAQRVARMGNWDWNILTGELYWSAQIFELFGIDPVNSPQTYERFINGVHPEDREPTHQAVMAAVEGRAPYNVEHRVLWPDGTVRVLHEQGEVTRDAAGRPLNMVGTVQDITERKAAEESLRLLGAAVEQAKESILITDAELDAPGPKIVFVNPAYTRMTGYAAEESLGKTPRILQGPRTDRAVLRRLRENLGRGEDFAGEAINYRKDGTEFDLEWQVAPVRDANGETTHFVAIQRDITERKHTAEKLRRSEALFRTLVQTSWDGFHLVEPTGVIIYESPSVTRLLGYLPEEMVGHNALEFIHPEDVAEITGGVDLLAAPGALRTVTLRVRHKDGRWRCVESYETNLLDHPDVRAIAVNYRDITERVEAEKAARRLAAIVESSADAIIGKDTSGNITSWNRGAEKVFGYTEHEMVGTSSMRLIPPDREGEEHYIVETVLRGESLEHFETKRLTKDGRLIDVAVTASQIRDRDGIVIGVSKLARDITARKAAEASAKQLLSVLEASLNEIYIFDSGTLRFDYVNESARRNLGFSMETMRGLTPAEIMPEFSLERFAEFVAALRRHEQEKIVSETVHRRADGTLYPVEMHLQFVEREGHDVFLVVVIDLTERKRVEEALKSSEAEFRALAEAMPQMVWITRADSQNIYHNQQWVDYTGLSVAESMGHGWNVALHPDDRERGARAWADATAAVSDYSVEFRIRRADGVYRWWLVRGAAQRNAAGEIVKWFGTCTDIHDLKEADLEIQSLNADLERRVAQRTAQLFNATQEAEKANRSKSDFLSRTSHELRTPLNAILGFGQLLERQGRDPEEADNIEQILRAGRHLLGLINEMLDISRIEAGHLELALQTVPLSETIGEALAIVRPMAINRGITIDPFQSSAHIVVDRQRFKQVVLNLLSNAVKYNHPGGRVTCRVTELGAERLRFSVTDTGIGIAAADAGKVFTAFERFGVAATQVEGIGLGLAITRQLTELMGGKIGFESELGTGSTFWVDLPRAGNPHVSLNTPAEVLMPGAAGLGGGPSRLLYIEDNVSNLRLVKRIIARRPQVEFLSAANGTLGLEMARTLHPGMILLDLHLPDIQGDDVLRLLLAEESTAAIPVIMLSADAVPARRAQMLAAGARAFLTKPLEIRAFLAVVDEFIPS